MNISEIFINSIINENILSEVGVVDYQDDFFRCPRRRKELQKTIDGSFASTDTPTFPLKNQFGATSHDLLKKSLNAAKSHLDRSGDERYADVILKIKSKMKNLETGEDRTPIQYQSSNMLKDIFSSKTAYVDK